MTTDTRGTLPSSARMAVHLPQPTQRLRDAWARVLENSTALDAASGSLDGSFRMRMTAFQYLVRRYVLVRSACHLVC